MYSGKKSFSVVEHRSSCSEIATRIYFIALKRKSPNTKSVEGLYKIPFCFLL